MLLTLWLSQPEVDKKVKAKQKSLELQDNISQAERAVNEKINSSVGKDDGSCR